MRVTAIRREPRGRRARAEVEVDGRVALALSLEVLKQSGLRPGDQISEEGLAALRRAEERHGALTAALRLLALRPRSEAEIRQRLARRAVPPLVIDETVARLAELSLVDDEAFARSWVESRDQTSPRGRRLLAWELYAKGVDRETVRDSLGAVNEEDAAYRAAGRRARSLASLPYADFRRRLGDFLLRRGFGSGTARSAVARLWEELRGVGPEGEDESGRDP